jgi:nucleotide-binding universal stress UspA family protein
MYDIVVGFDESEAAGPALEWALDEAQDRNRTLTVVTVVPSLVQPGFWGGTYQYPASHEDLELAQRSAEVAVEKLMAERVENSKVRYEVKVESGAPADVLLRYADEAHHIVVGSRGGGGFSRLLLGSVSTALVHHAHCPVTVVPVNRPQYDER